ncbi:RRM domain containing protein [Pyrenophora teres f. maculata]|nr:RRM domain containing protein [Pyrenophora teres f. maculata]
MVAPNTATTVSFESFVKQTREKKKNEALAQQFLGGGNRDRKTNASGGGAGVKARVESEKPSLLSRINGGAGVQKRSASAKPAGSIDSKWQHDLHKLNNPRGPASARHSLPRTASSSQVERNSRTYEKFAPVLGRGAAARSNDALGFSIRGVANTGPCTVIASNFAPGTTAADVEAVMSPIGGETLGCRILSANPTVMVELQFVSRDGAENVIATFNNQKADGRLLYVYMKDVPATTHMAQSRAPPAHLTQSVDDVDVDMDGGSRSSPPGNFREGRYGFNDATRRDPPRGPRRRY